MFSQKKFGLPESLIKAVVEATKSHTVPKTEKDKKLAALAHPKDKITHADVMTGRGVKKEEAEIEEAAGASKEKEEKFHNKLDKLVHKTFGHSPDEKKMTKEEVELDESIKTTHKDPLVTVHDKDGLHTHANLSVANRIFYTKVKHTDVHKGPVTVTSGREDKNKLKFALSKHHAKAVEDDMKEEAEINEAPVDGVAAGSMEGDKHMCASKVMHKEWKEGTPLFSQHAEPSEDGTIAWYDVMFEHGIEKKVPTSELEILVSESHMNHKKKK